MTSLPLEIVDVASRGGGVGPYCLYYPVQICVETRGPFIHSTNWLIVNASL